MDPITTWGAILSFITTVGAAGATGAYYKMGRVEGKMEAAFTALEAIYAALAKAESRLDDHSDEIAALEALPATVAALVAQVAGLVEKVDSLRHEVVDLHAVIREERGASHARGS